MQIALAAALLTGLTLNGHPAMEVATVHGSPTLLDSADIAQQFQLTTADGDQVLRFIKEQLFGIDLKAASVAIVFDNVPARVAARCIDGTRPEQVTSHSLRSCLAAQIAKPLVEKVAHDAGWNLDVFAQLVQWRNHLQLYRPESLFVLSDCDNTAWAGDVADAVFAVAAEEGIVNWDGAPVLPRYPRKPEHKTPFEYYEYLYDISPPLSYNYVTQAFQNLTLREAHVAFQRARVRKMLPTPYGPLRALARSLMDNGTPVGFASASPLFMVMPMLAEAGYNVPLWAIEAMDMYILPPRGDADATQIKLSDLIQSDATLHSWVDVLAKYGDYRIGRPSEIAAARKGKTAAGRAMVDRHVLAWNQRHPEALVTPADMRLAGVFGDNFAPFSDRPGASPTELGNDQGMVMALNNFPAQGLLVLNIYRATRNGAQFDLQEKIKNHRNYRAMIDQLHTANYPLIVLEQIGVAKGGPGLGTFLPDAVP